VGNFPPAYYDERPRYATINDAYAPMPYARPMVDVQVAPPMVRAEISIGGPGWRANALVGGPPAPIYVAPPPPPAVQIGVGINLGGPPAVIERREYIEERRHHDHGRHEGWREPPRFGEPGRREPPARYAPVHAPVNAPMFNRAPPQHAGPPMRGPASTPPGHTMGPPSRGPAPVAPGRSNDHHQGRHR